MKFKEFSKTTTMTGNKRWSDLFGNYKNCMNKQYTTSHDQVRGFACKEVPWFDKKCVSDHWFVCSPFHIITLPGEMSLRRVRV